MMMMSTHIIFVCLLPQQLIRFKQIDNDDDAYLNWHDKFQKNIFTLILIHHQLYYGFNVYVKIRTHVEGQLAFHVR